MLINFELYHHLMSLFARPREPARLIAAVVLTNLAGIAGSFFTATSLGSWYDMLQKPWFNPPGWVFAPVWTALYVLMGIALYLVWMEGTQRTDVRFALGIFAVQLALNALWSYFFFGLRSVFFGFLEICVLWIAIVFTIVMFARVRRDAALLLVPYIAWVTFAAILSYSILLLNG